MRVSVGTLLFLAALLGGAACSLNVDAGTGPCGEPVRAGPTPGSLAFVSDAVGGQFDICLINTDGSGATPLVTSLADDWWPAWSPDGSKLAFQTNRNFIPAHDTVPPHPEWDIYVINVDGSGETQLTTDTTNEAQPAWSPDGKRIAFVTDRDGNNEIYLMNGTGGNLRRLTTAAGTDEQPAWSPDGAKIAFVSNRSGNLNIWVMDSTGANPVNLTNDASVDLGPAWSPDGSKIAFHSNRPGNFAIYVMNADGSGVTQITNARLPSELASWSPDSKRIVFDSDGELWIAQASGGGGLTQVTHSKFVHDFMARWRP